MGQGILKRKHDPAGQKGNANLWLTHHLFSTFSCQRSYHVQPWMSEKSLWNTNKKSDTRILLMNKLQENIVFLEV